MIIFIYDYVGSNLSYHTHIIDGTPVSHSHPYSNAQHQHSANGMVTIAFLTAITIVEGGSATEITFFEQLIQIIESEVLSSHDFSYINHSGLRGPPVL